MILTCMHGIRLLREFINGNISMLYSLNRFVTMNALSDVVGGPTVNAKNMHVVNDVTQQSVDNRQIDGTIHADFNEIDDDV